MSTVTASPAGKASRGQTQMILSHDCQENACVEHTGVFLQKFHDGPVSFPVVY